jgi:hypothetical protein
MQGVLVLKFKVAQSFEIVPTNFEKGFLDEVFDKFAIDSFDMTEDAFNDHAGCYGLKTAPEFHPQFGSQVFVSRGEKKPE